MKCSNSVAIISCLVASSIATTYSATFPPVKRQYTQAIADKDAADRAIMLANTFAKEQAEIHLLSLAATRSIATGVSS